MKSDYAAIAWFLMFWLLLALVFFAHRVPCEFHPKALRWAGQCSTQEKIDDLSRELFKLKMQVDQKHCVISNEALWEP